MRLSLKRVFANLLSVVISVPVFVYLAGLWGDIGGLIAIMISLTLYKYANEY